MPMGVIYSIITFLNVCKGIAILDAKTAHEILFVYCLPSSRRTSVRALSEHKIKIIQFQVLVEQISLYNTQILCIDEVVQWMF